MARIRPISVNDILDIIFTDKDTLYFSNLAEADRMLAKIEFSKNNWGNINVYSGFINEIHVRLSVTNENEMTPHFYVYKKSFGYMENNQHIPHHEEDLPCCFEYTEDGRLHTARFFEKGEASRSANKPISISYKKEVTEYNFKPKTSRIYISKHSKDIDSKIENIDFIFEERTINLLELITVLPKVNDLSLEQLYFIEDYLDTHDLNLIDMYHI